MKKEKIRESKKGKNEVKWEKWHRSPKMRRLRSVEWWGLAQGALTRWAVSARPRAEVPAAPAPPSPQGGPGSPLRSCPGSRGWTRARCGGRSPCWRRLKKQKEHPHEWAGETLCCKPRGMLCGLLGTTTKSKPLKNIRQLLKKDFYGKSQFQEKKKANLTRQNAQTSFVNDYRPVPTKMVKERLSQPITQGVWRFIFASRNVALLKPDSHQFFHLRGPRDLHSLSEQPFKPPWPQHGHVL